MFGHRPDVRFDLHLSLYWVNSLRAQFFISISCRNLQYSSARASKSLPKISKEASFNSTDCFSAWQAFSSESSFSLKSRHNKICFQKKKSARIQTRYFSEGLDEIRGTKSLLPYFFMSRYWVDCVRVQLNFHHLSPLKEEQKNICKKKEMHWLYSACKSCHESITTTSRSR